MAKEYLSVEGLREVLQVVKKQEEILQFERFDNEDAFELGCLMRKEMKTQGVALSVRIKKLNGNVVFAYSPEGTTLDNEVWMRRKFNTASLLEESSFQAAVANAISGGKVADHGLSEEDYKFVGGAFPIRIKNSGILMIAIVSGLPHEKDHQFAADCIAKYLGVEIPKVEGNVPIP